MGEGFEVKEPHVAGYGLLTRQVADQYHAICMYVQDNASAKAGFDGLMAALRGPVDLYASSSSSRISRVSSLLHNTAQELTRTAWAYTGMDKSHYEIYSDGSFEKPNQKPQVVGYKDFPNPAPFPVTADPAADLKSVDIAPADIKKQVDEVGGSIQIINDAVHAITHWYPVDAIVAPMSGNWNALKGAGEALTNAGNAIDHSLSNLSGSLGQLDASWNGGAAQSFMDYITKLVGGAGDEAALARIVGDVYGVVAGEIEKVAHWIVTKLKKAVDTVVQAASVSWVPGYGWYRIIDAVLTAIDIFQEAQAIIERLKEVVETVTQIVEIAKDPVGALQDAAQAKLDDTLKPIKDKIDQYQKGAEVAADIARLADANTMAQIPQDKYASGDDPRRAGA